MAVIRDVMPAFELFQPASIEDAQAVLDRYGSGAWVLAGGLDSFDWLKDRIKRPQALVDLAGIPELKGIRPWQDGIEIGAMTTLTEVVRHPVVRERYGILLEAAEAAASPQIRNQGTIGGNVSQDTRCWYYRAGWSCYRAGGNICYADTPEAINREHAILGADRCVAVSPSDTAPALIVLDAQMVVRTAGGGELTIAAEDYFIGPATDITRMTILQPGDLLTAIRLPGTWAASAQGRVAERPDDPALAGRSASADRPGAPGATFYFEKVRDRAVWDFALVSVASAMVMNGTTIERMRLSVNGVAARPLRLEAVEDIVRGKPRNEATAMVAANLAIEGAQPLRFNAYKVPLMRNLVKRAIRGVEEGTWTS
jgi:xanthine dehydrogenase YagS FAD-binding subunit